LGAKRPRHPHQPRPSEESSVPSTAPEQDHDLSNGQTRCHTRAPLVFADFGATLRTKCRARCADCPTGTAWQRRSNGWARAADARISTAMDVRGSLSALVLDRPICLDCVARKLNLSLTATDSVLVGVSKAIQISA